MPLHVVPHIRALEEALEAEGLIKSLDSAGVAVQKAKESAGTVVKVVPVAQKRIIRGTVYTAS
jgi:hypothetical protein